MKHSLQDSSLISCLSARAAFFPLGKNPNPIIKILKSWSGNQQEEEWPHHCPHNSKVPTTACCGQWRPLSIEEIWGNLAGADVLGAPVFVWCIYCKSWHPITTAAVGLDMYFALHWTTGGLESVGDTGEVWNEISNRERQSRNPELQQLLIE